MTILIMVMFLTVVGTFATRACTTLTTARGWLAARDRWALITGFVTAVTAFAVVSMPLKEVVVPGTVWVAGVGLLFGGVLGAVLRWPDLTWYAGKHPLWRAIGVSTTLCSCGLLIGVALM